MSKLTDYGTLVLAQLAATEGELSTSSAVAEATHLGQPTVSKLLKLLARAGLVVSERGAQGGYALARSPAQISAAEIIDALEGPFALTECSAVTGTCDLQAHCRVAGAWQRINGSIRRSLQSVTLEDLQVRAEPLAALDLKQSVVKSAATP